MVYIRENLHFTSYQPNAPWALEILHFIESRMNFLNQKRKPQLLDIELITIDLTFEFLGLDSEGDLFRKLTDNLCSKIERSVYNRLKRGL